MNGPLLSLLRTSRLRRGFAWLRWTRFTCCWWRIDPRATFNRSERMNGCRWMNSDQSVSFAAWLPKTSCCLTDVHLLRFKNARNELLKADLKVFQNIRQNRKLQGNSRTFFPERFWSSLFQICDYINPCLVDPLRGIRKAPTEPSQKSSIMFSTLFSLFSLYQVYYTFSTWIRPKLYILFLLLYIYFLIFVIWFL